MNPKERQGVNTAKSCGKCKLFRLDTGLSEGQSVVTRPSGTLLGLPEVVMRYFGLLLVTLLTLGCGNPGKPGNNDPFKVAMFVVPSITNLTPNNIPVNSVPFTMTINGSNFSNDAVVFWQGNPQLTFFVTSNQLMVTVTNADLQFMALVPIYVHTLGQNSNTVDFNVTPQ